MMMMLMPGLETSFVLKVAKLWRQILKKNLKALSISVFFRYMCRRNSVCLSSVMFVLPTQPVEIYIYIFIHTKCSNKKNKNDK